MKQEDAIENIAFVIWASAGAHEAAEALFSLGYRLVPELTLLTDEERMNVDIPCELKCGCTRPLMPISAECVDCAAIQHEKAQLAKIKKQREEGR